MNLLTHQKLKQENLNDVEKDQSVNQSRTTEDSSERVPYQLKIKEMVETTWLFDTGADAHFDSAVRVGTAGKTYIANNKSNTERSKRTRPWSLGDLLVRGFLWETKVQFTVVVARDARRCLLRGTQLRGKRYTSTLNQHESFLTQPKRRHKSNDVT